MTNDAANSERDATITELSDSELQGIAGGLFISLVTKMPNYTGPKLHVPSSIAGGEINSNSTDNNLPDSGGGIIV
jgi:hypothetical protein